MMTLDFRKMVTFVVKVPKLRTLDLLLRAALKSKMSTESCWNDTGAVKPDYLKRNLPRAI
jgi:hypothetical protein